MDLTDWRGWLSEFTKVLGHEESGMIARIMDGEQALLLLLVPFFTFTFVGATPLTQLTFRMRRFR